MTGRMMDQAQITMMTAIMMTRAVPLQLNELQLPSFAFLSLLSHISLAITLVLLLMGTLWARSTKISSRVPERISLLQTVVVSPTREAAYQNFLTMVDLVR